MTVGNKSAVANKEKVGLLAYTFVKVNNLSNLTKEGRRGREKTSLNIEPLCKKGNMESGQDAPFSMADLKRALSTLGKTSHGKNVLPC